MKVKVSTKILNAKDQEIKDPERDSALTLRDIIVSSILAPIDGESDKIKYEKYELFRKIKDPKIKEIDFTAEEIVLIKKVIGKFQPPLIMGQSWDLLEGKQY